MPNLVKDKANGLHLVYGNGDSILYQYSGDGGVSFSSPVTVGIVSGLFSFASRGPQIACSDSGVSIIACDKTGNIYSFLKGRKSHWLKAARVNEVDTVAKEGLIALSGDGNKLYAVWLDLRGNKRNKIAGAASFNGGKTWLANCMVYSSPDSSVCECCKPLVVVRGGKVFVMFRNWLDGQRDLYVATSTDTGAHFKTVEKMGKGSWALNGCPMDGGGIAVNTENHVQTVWRRHDTIFTCSPGNIEKNIGIGKACTIANAGKDFVYAWVENGNIVCFKPDGTKRQLGKGIAPLLKTIDENNLICIWENEGQINMALISL